MANFEYQRHPHTFGRTNPEPPIEGWNNRIGLWITRFVGTMWSAYLFAGLALLSLPSALGTGDVRVIVDWVAQTFLQLVLVSVVIVGQNQMNKAAEVRAEATYKDATALLHEVQQLQQHLEHQDAELERLRKALTK